MNSRGIVVFFVLLSSSLAFAQATSKAQASDTQPNKRHPVVHGERNQEDAGSRIFRQNCSRCHNTPEGFSPRISDTVLRHMSVRASISMRDRVELLRFLNP